MCHQGIQMLLVASLLAAVAPSAIDPATTLECHRREYTFKAIKADSLGRRCWDHITVMSCWGRCDSHEIADWKFPYKKSYHPVCMHDRRQLRQHKLRYCEVVVEPGTNIYEYYEADTCSCQVCRSTHASCDSLHDRLNRMP